MENKRNTQPMSEWDALAVTHLNDLWNKHLSGELKAGDVDVVFANARARVEETIKDQEAQEAESLYTTA